MSSNTPIKHLTESDQLRLGIIDLNILQKKIKKRHARIFTELTLTKAGFNKQSVSTQHFRQLLLVKRPMLQIV